MSYSVTANYYLRNLYGSNKDYIIGSTRLQASNASVVSADSKALAKGAKKMMSLDYGSYATDDDIENAMLGNNIKAFIDTYNNTIDSASDSDLKDIKKLVSKMKTLGKEYEEELEELGITFDDDGYMTIDSSAVENLDNKKFESVFGEDSDFTKTVRSLARKLYKHIDASI
ncbi:MAG: hypothetical protein K6G87_02580 [Butyrivibrio sp.]|uniref:hypothetical protein n=1 Tax=Butyrivibrio sp. TaxID=28121 RepID=UPI0025E38B3B|nr:hypothetical protein [Butyrivibrio sp.]MCR5770103.1 hypothetical protein [Butyrivibrio sp.]